MIYHTCAGCCHPMRASSRRTHNAHCNARLAQDVKAARASIHPSRFNVESRRAYWAAKHEASVDGQLAIARSRRRLPLPNEVRPISD